MEAEKSIETTQAEENRTTDKLPLSEKISYSFTDLAGNMLYVTITTYIMYFYTDVFGISVAAAGLILLIARVVDAISAPVWGIIIDHTQTKWGQSRPYFLWLAIPFGVATVLAFLSPTLPDTGKYWYAAITYILAAGIIYTGIQTPINSILPNLTKDSNERVAANTFRMIGGNVGAFIAGSAVLPLVGLVGQGNDRIGFPLAIGILAILAIFLLLFAFKNLKERHTNNTEPIPLKKSIRATYRNWPWFLLIGSFILFWIAQTSRISMSVYYAQYNLGNANLAAIFNGLTILGMLGTLLTPFLVKIANKHMTMIIGFLIGIAGQTLMAFFEHSIPLIMISWVIAIFGFAIAIAMPFAMLADTVDYGEWKNGVRATGFLTAIGGAFCIQLGSGFGSFIPSLIMEASGFVANQAQSAASLSAIKFSFIWLPVIISIIAIIPMIFYRRFEKQESKIKKDLQERHQ
ncbi:MULTISPECIES: MFS transporter [Oceanobacillus]|uniref:MFS transporter n=1 Tax=Oceanobacillus aidingensis TaxID=645964 RepID=A0ABV9JYR9_9BACI|nr:MFS transporter [Oceanobacillus oncorhynchi]MDM8099839.1 MFS transporter [Oceanobacillus oncorhynchi]UUI40379.1 MFS transporter [Oceanobacillus oncorhynchi]